MRAARRGTRAARRRTRAGRRGAAAAAAWGGLALAGCAATWDAEALAARRPELAERPLGRLGDATPYLWAARDTLTLFLCRFPGDAPLRVALPADASDAERALLVRALRAWEAVVPGLRLVPVTSGEGAAGAAPAAIRIRFREAGPEGARTAAECAVEPPGAQAGAVLDARLVAADVVLRRAEGDAWGRPVPLSEAELLGSALHELGHALGLQGHARRGPSVLVRDVDAVRRAGRRVGRGEPLREDAMAALYALPSGLVIERRALAPGATRRIDAAAARARAAGREGARVRVGDGSVRIAWGPEPTFEYYLRDPVQLIRGEAEFSESLLPPAPPPPGARRDGRGAAQPMSGSISRALARRFAEGAVSPSAFSTIDRR